MPALLVTIAWIVVCAYAIYRVVTLANTAVKPWFPILFYIAVFIISLSYLWPLLDT
ncbi:hypothetical protein [Aureibacillus halotolerans]|uniref:Uncharacterized protein n=1 Tax=Aureibacillus halotolerans TaxID=1508390 RepID=A0A4R6U365_9BACI|nr:hypothetical protein [Aureibacillus halotolerans]TDQ40898.1 hypothetical protein EV213_105244 [Aureibacillus halotolerans]